MRKNVRFCELLAFGHHLPQEVDSWIMKKYYQAVHVRGPTDCELISTMRATIGTARNPVLLIYNLAALTEIVDRGYDLSGFKVVVFVTPESVGLFRDPVLFWVDHRPRVSAYWPPEPFDGYNFPPLLDRIDPIGQGGQLILRKLRNPPRFEPYLEDFFQEQKYIARIQHFAGNDLDDEEICEDLSELDPEFSKKDSSWKRKDARKAIRNLASPYHQQMISNLLSAQWRKPQWMNSFKMSLWDTVSDVLTRMSLVFDRENFGRLAPKLLETAFDYQLARTTRRFYNKTTRNECSGDDSDLKKQFVLMRQWMDSPAGIHLEGAYRDLLLTHKRRCWGSVVNHHNVSPIDLHLLLSYQPPSNALASEYHPLDSKIDHYDVNLVSDAVPPQEPYWPPPSPMEDFFPMVKD